MNNYLTVTANNKPLAIPADFSIDFSLKNPMFHDTEEYSLPAQIPFDGNRHLLTNLDDPQSSVRPVSLERLPMQIDIAGVPVFFGELRTSDDEELEDSISISTVSGKSFKNLIADLQCNEIPVKDEILIGETIGEVSVEVRGIHKVRLYQGDNYIEITPGVSEFGGTPKPIESTVTFTPPALGFSLPAHAKGSIVGPAEYTTDGDPSNDYTPKKPVIQESYINVDKPYPFPYCNARIAYKHHALAEDGTTDDSTQNTKETGPYMVLEADRPQSGICFYVLYFLDCLFAHLGLQWDNSELTKIEDMKRLCFFTTKCSYTTQKIGAIHGSNTESLNLINEWLDTRGCGAQLSLNAGEDSTLGSFFVKNGTYYTDTMRGFCRFLQDVNFVNGESYENILVKWPIFSEHHDSWTNINLKSRLEDPKIVSLDADICRMYADGKNFPNAAVTSVIESLENQFGIRFIYDAEAHKVTARLLRDMYRSQDAPLHFHGAIDRMVPVVEKTSGVRICYSAEDEAKDQTRNIRNQVRDYDIDYNYIDYPDPSLPPGSNNMAAASTSVIDKQYKDFIIQADRTDNKVYIDQFTGNAYRLKVNRETNLEPRYFEAGALKGLELGDCSEDNEDNIIEFSSDFQPVIMSCVNAEMVKTAATGSSPIGIQTALSKKEYQPRLVAYVDEDMEHEYVEQFLDWGGDIDVGGMTIRASLHLLENYDVSGTENGCSPLQNIDWGLAVSIMRGGGTDTTLSIYDANYDGFGNYRWHTTAGNYAMTLDSIDPLGNEYDYNGSGQPGIVGEHFSLKIRAYKQPSWATAPLCRSDYTDSEGTHYILTRGTGDRFMYDHAYFILHRRMFRITGECEPAFLHEIQSHWENRWIINEKVGYISKIDARADAATPKVSYTLDFFEI